MLLSASVLLGNAVVDCSLAQVDAVMELRDVSTTTESMRSWTETGTNPTLLLSTPSLPVLQSSPHHGTSV